MCTATNLLRKVTLNISSRIQLKLISYIKATENKDVLRGKAKESRVFLKSGPAFPKSVPAAPPSALAPKGALETVCVHVGLQGKRDFGIWGCARPTAQHPSVSG